VIPPEKNAVGVLTYPCGHCRPEIVAWLAQTGIGLGRVPFLNQEGLARAVNDLLVALLAEGRDWLLVVERDIVPVEMAAWWQAEGDVVGVWYPHSTGDPEHTQHMWEPWESGPAWHRGLWRVHRRVPETMPRPWFPARPRRGCRCRDFAEEARRNGFSVLTAGRAEHAECPIA